MGEVVSRRGNIGKISCNPGNDLSTLVNMSLDPQCLSHSRKIGDQRIQKKQTRYVWRPRPEAFIAELVVEGLAVTVFPWWPGLDVQAFRASLAINFTQFFLIAFVSSVLTQILMVDLERNYLCALFLSAWPVV